MRMRQRWRMRRAITRTVRRRMLWRRGFFGVGGLLMLLVSVVVCSGRPVLTLVGIIAAVVLIIGAVLIS